MPDRLKLRIMPETDPDLGSMCDLCNKKLPELNDPECAAECELRSRSFVFFVFFSSLRTRYL